METDKETTNKKIMTMKNEQPNAPDRKEGEQKEKIKVPLKPYKSKDLAKIYGVCGKTFHKWVKELKKEVGKRNGYYYSIPQVKIIFSELLLPSWIEVE